MHTKPARRKFVNTIFTSFALFILTLSIFSLVLSANRRSEIKTSFGAITGDCNSDNRVDILDFQLLSNSFGRTSGQTGYDGRCDFNNSNSIDILDFQILSNNFGRTGTATATPTRTPTPGGPTVTLPPPPPPRSGIWISQNEIMQRPTSGTAWQALYSDASGSWGTASVSNQDSNHDQMVLAGALVCARTGQFCDKTRQGLLSAIGTESGARWLAIGRNLLGYTIATDVMKNSGNLTGTDLSRMTSWLASFLTRTLAHNNTGEQIVDVPFSSGSNASAQEGAMYAAIAAYTNNTSKLNYTWNRFRLYSCDRANNPEQTINVQTGFSGGWSHTTDYSQACAVNPSGASKNGHKIDGAVINDIVRGGSFQWPPGYTGYEITGLQGYVPAAVVLHRAGFPAFQVSNRAVLRAVDYVCYLDKNTTTTWWETNRGRAIMHLTKAAYGSIPSGCSPAYPVGDGMTIGYTDWTHPNSI